MPFFDDNKEDEFYDNQVAYLQTWIEKFTNTASGLDIAHCIKLYLNIAKYEYKLLIPLPEALAKTKAIIRVKYQIRNYIGKLNMDGIAFPASVSYIQKTEQHNNLAINVHGATVSSKLKNKKVNTFPYHISGQPNTMQRANLLFTSGDAEKSTKH